MAGVIQLTRELAIAWAPHGIRVNAIQACQFVNPGLQAMIDDPAQARDRRAHRVGHPARAGWAGPTRWSGRSCSWRRTPPRW